ncbi:carbon dioxide concentrating mechanism protein [Capilliphycus salinus ALCB114379]|uniref:carbon dioxide concentrating mechanism protein n=1 Tax=Capilliphycus salinus TaxID=2768948 RepID=UPI0039A4DCD2
MYRSPPQPLNNASAFVSGDVTIDPSVAIATGAILQADRDSQIVIATGVCIGMGAIVHAHQGKIEIEAGASIGAGVLVVGHGTIGAKACIGAETTLLNPAIAAKQVVPAGSIVGDQSRSVTLSSASEEAEETEEAKLPREVEPDSTVEEVEPDSTDQPEESPPEEPSPEKPPTESAPDSTTGASSLEKSVNSPATIVYGQVRLNHLLNTLLPHRKSLNNSKPGDRSG